MRAFAFVVVAGLPNSVLAQSPFDPSRLLARSDSFAVVVQGRTVGGARETIERVGETWRLTSAQQMASMSQRTVVEFSRGLAMTSVRQTGQARGQNMNINVVYAGGRARGVASTPAAQGIKTIAVDTVVPGGVVDDNALQTLLPTLPLAAGKVFTLQVFASGQGITKALTATVAGAEMVTVPAGAFDAWKVDVTGTEIPVTFWVAKQGPRVVKLGFAGAPMSFELEK